MAMHFNVALLYYTRFSAQLRPLQRLLVPGHIFEQVDWIAILFLATFFIVASLAQPVACLAKVYKSDAKHI